MSEPNAIDSKKTENETGTTEPAPNYGDFFKDIFLSVIVKRIIISFVFIGSIGLYTCKIAQSGLLPDNVDYIPFGNKVKQIEQIPINVNVVKEYGLFGFGWLLGETPKKIWSTKIIFNDKNEGSIIQFLKSLQTNPKNASFFGLYISDIILNIIAINNLFINKIYGIANEFLPESLIIILFPFCFIILFAVLFILNIVLCFFNQIKHWNDFFMDKNVKDNKVNWLEPFTYFKPWRMFLFFLYILFLFFPFAFTMPFFIVIYSFISPLFISGETQNTKRTFNFLTFIKDVLIYKSQLFLIILSIYLILDSYKFLGSASTVGCAVGILIVFFGLHLYNQYIPKNDSNLTSGLVSTKPAKIK